MPLYEYECENGHRFEKIQKFSDPPIEVCPTCGAKVEKLISTPAIQFKGSGWYITDYARKGESSGENAGGAKTEKAAEKTADKTTSESSAAAPSSSASESSETKTSKPAESPAATTSSKSDK